MKFRQARKRSLWGRKVNTVYKTWRGTSFELKKLRKPKFRLEAPDACCSDWIGNKVSIFISIIRHHLDSYRNVFISKTNCISFLCRKRVKETTIPCNGEKNIHIKWKKCKACSNFYSSLGTIEGRLRVLFLGFYIYMEAKS